MGPREELDTWVWSLDAQGCFSIRSMYECHAIARLHHQPFPFIWRSILPSKYRFHLWLAYLNKVLTLDNLVKKGVQLVNRCSLGCQNMESASHLFMHCPFAFHIWGFFLGRFRLFWVMPERVAQLLEMWFSIPHIGLSQRGREL